VEVVVVETGGAGGGEEDGIESETGADLPSPQFDGEAQQPRKDQPKLPLF
jgi:hypothetical protein